MLVLVAVASSLSAQALLQREESETKFAVLITAEATEDEEAEEEYPKLEVSTQSQRSGGERTAMMEDLEGNLFVQKIEQDFTERSSAEPK